MMTDEQYEIHKQNLEVYRSYAVPLEENLLYRKSAISQYSFMLYSIYPALGETVSWIDYGHHISKSCKLPVYHTECSWGKFWFRSNFHDVILSVEMKEPLSPGLAALLIEGQKEEVPSWAEGMEAVVFPLPKAGEKKFSVYYGTEHHLYAKLHLISQVVGKI